MNTDPNVIGVGDDDFWVEFGRGPSSGSLLSMVYATSPSSGIYVANVSSYAVTELSEVPLPAALLSSPPALLLSAGSPAAGRSKPPSGFVSMEIPEAASVGGFFVFVFRVHGPHPMS